MKCPQLRFIAIGVPDDFIQQDRDAAASRPGHSLTHPSILHH